MAAVITDEESTALLDTRATDPPAIRRAYQTRRRRTQLLSDQGTLFLAAADHPARDALGSGGDPPAMAARRSLLDHLLTALANPAVDGVLGTPDVIEELLLDVLPRRPGWTLPPSPGRAGVGDRAGAAPLPVG